MTYILQEQHRQYFMGKAEPNTRVQSPGEHIWPCRRQSWRLAAVALDFRALLPPTWHGKGVRSSSQAFTLLFSHPGSPCGLFFVPVGAWHRVLVLVAPAPAASHPHSPPSRNPHGGDLRFDYFQILVCVKFDLRKHFSPTCCRIEGV